MGAQQASGRRIGKKCEGVALERKEARTGFQNAIRRFCFHVDHQYHAIFALVGCQRSESGHPPMTVPQYHGVTRNDSIILFVNVEILELGGDGFCWPPAAFEGNAVAVDAGHALPILIVVLDENSGRLFGQREGQAQDVVECLRGLG